MKVTFEGNSVHEIVAHMLVFIKAFDDRGDQLAGTSEVHTRVGTIVDTIDEAVANRAEKEAMERKQASAAGQETDEKSSRRRSLSGDRGTKTKTTKPKSGNGRRKKKASTEDDDEITDTDVVRAASNAAQFLTPDGVTAVLKTFDATEVQALDQEQRAQFISDLRMLTDKNAGEESDG